MTTRCLVVALTTKLLGRVTDTWILMVVN